MGQNVGSKVNNCNILPIENVTCCLRYLLQTVWLDFMQSSTADENWIALETIETMGKNVGVKGTNLHLGLHCILTNTLEVFGHSAADMPV